MKAKYLKDNAVLYIVAPSFGCTTSPYKERLEKAILNFEKLNYRIILGENCYRNSGTAASNTPLNRAVEFMNAYASDADAILSAGGGELMVEILEYIDFQRIKTLPPKWFIGFSDNTNLTYTLTTICDLETVYGNNAPNFYRLPLSYDTRDTLRLLQGEKRFSGYKKWQLAESKELFPKYKLTEEKIITAVHYTKPFSGILIGGCLDCLTGLCGTRFDYTAKYAAKHDKEGIIFFMEACDLTSIGIRRALFQLKNAGWFTNVKGFLIGRSRLYDDQSFGTTPLESYIDLLKDFNVPLLLNVDLGHLPPSLPIRCGAYATVSLEKKNIVIEYKD